jgi:hypothetical protein
LGVSPSWLPHWPFALEAQWPPFSFEPCLYCPNPTIPCLYTIHVLCILLLKYICFILHNYYLSTVELVNKNVWDIAKMCCTTFCVSQIFPVCVCQVLSVPCVLPLIICWVAGSLWGVPQIQHCHTQHSTLYTPHPHSYSTHSRTFEHNQFFLSTLIFSIHSDRFSFGWAKKFPCMKKFNYYNKSIYYNKNIKQS